MKRTLQLISLAVILNLAAGPAFADGPGGGDPSPPGNGSGSTTTGSSGSTTATAVLAVLNYLGL